MKKELYFYFYVTEDYKDYFTNKIHFKCLEYYKDRFDTVTIGISINDTNDVDTIYVCTDSGREGEYIRANQ